MLQPNSDEAEGGEEEEGRIGKGTTALVCCMCCCSRMEGTNGLAPTLFLDAPMLV